MKKQSYNHAFADQSPRQLATHLNMHFSCICTTLTPLDTAILTAYLPASVPPPTIQQHEVYFHLRRLNASKAPHPSDIPTRLLKEFALEMSGPVTKIFNKCRIVTSLLNGSVPQYVQYV